MVHALKMKAVEPGKLWAPVVIIGDPTTSFKAYEAIHSVVDGEYTDEGSCFSILILV